MPNSMPFITAKTLALFKPEADPGTAETLTSADCSVRSLKPIGVEFSKDAYILDEATGRHSVRGAVMGKSSITVTRQVALSAGAALGTAPKWSRLALTSGHRVAAVLTFSADLITANSVAGSVSADWGAPVAITPVVYNTSPANTMTLIANAIKTAGGAGTEAVVGGLNNRSIFVYHPSKIMSLSGFAVTLGASQATVSLRTSITPHAAFDSQTGTGAVQLTPQTGNAVVATGKGFIGDMTVRMASLGEPLIAEFRHLGALASMADATPFVLTSPDTTFPPRTVGAIATDGSGNNQHIGSFELRSGHDLQLKHAPQDATGYLMGYIARRENRLGFSPQVKLQATDASYTRWDSGTQTAFEFATAPLNGQRIVIRVPKLQITELTLTDRNGEAVFEKTGIPCEDVGNDAYEISIEGPAA